MSPPRVIALLAVLAATFVATAEQADDAPADVMREADWNALKSRTIRTVQVAPGWSPPRLVAGPVNSLGWEDSASISPDGKTLTFSYIPVDLFSWTLTGPDFGRFARFRRGPGRGVSPEFSLDTFSATRADGRFGAPRKHPISLRTDPVYQSETGLMEAPDGALYYNTNHPVTQEDGDTDIYQDGRRLPFNTAADENDPACLGDELFFWSEHRPGAAGKHKSLWVVRRTDGEWGEPRPLPEPVNSPDWDAWQPHPAAQGRLYFTSSRESLLSIHVSRRKGPEAWTRPERVVWPSEGSAAVGVAEPSLTADGAALYFCVLFRNPAGCYDLDIACTTRRGD